MGKRELLLIAIFVAAGAIVYRVTAPADASGNGFSISKLIEHIRSEVRGQNVELQAMRTASVDADGITTLRLAELRGTVRIKGEEREDVAVELKATVYGVDQAQAQQFEKAVSLALEPDGSDLELRVSVKAPEMRRRSGVQLTVRVPARLAVEMTFGGGELEVSHVAGVTLERGGGKIVLNAIAGPVKGELHQGTLELNEAQEVDLETRRTEVRLMHVAGGVKLDAQGGDIRIRTVGGPAELALERVDAELEDVQRPIKIDGNGGQLHVRNPRGPVTIDVERMEIALTLTTAVPVEASTAGDTLEVALPSQGLRLQAVANHGQIRASDPAITMSDEDDIRRAVATLRGGGPLIKLETTRGDIVIR